MDIPAEASFVVFNGLVKIIPSPMITDSIFMTQKKHTHSVVVLSDDPHMKSTPTDTKFHNAKRSRFSLTTQLIKVNTHTQRNKHHACIFIGFVYTKIEDYTNEL